MSQRILALTAGLVLGRAAGRLDPETDAVVSRFLARNVAFLLDNIEHELRNNHVERNLAALCLYLSHAERVPPGLAARIVPAVRAIVAATVLPDGTQIERSPMYQGMTATALAVLAETPFLPEPLRCALAGAQLRARRAQAVLTHPDGGIALFNDAWLGELPVDDGPPAPEGRVLLPDGGYGRLARGGELCLLDAGAIGPAWNPGHGHSDFLSVEIDLGGRRFVVDPGTSEYDSGPARLRERGAAAHNGPAWDGVEPVAYLGSFRVGRLAGARLLPDLDALAGGQAVVAGRFACAAGTARRAVAQLDGGFLVADRWSAAQPAGRVTWLVGDAWTAAGGEGFAFRGPDGAPARIQPLLCGGVAAPAADRWASHYGRTRPATACRVQAAAVDGGQRMLTWIGAGPPPAGGEAMGAEMLALLAEPGGAG